MIPSPDTIAAIATPPGRGGVGIVRVSGSGAGAVAAGIVGDRLVPRVATHAVFRGADGEAVDEGLAIFFPAPNSYTGESVVELHGHGGPVVLRLVLARCLQLGARLAQPGEFTQRAFLNGKIDLAQAEGVADLIDAATSTAARAAVRSLTGEFSRQIHALADALTELRMFTEATLDFPEEDLDFLEAADARAKMAAIRAGLDAILAKARQGVLLRDGLAVVLIGQPNVGKSSLMNRLVGDDVAIVTEIAGTTRDTVRCQIEIAGVPLTVIDTAGLRPTRDPIESLGIGRTWGAVEGADLAIVVVDARDADDGLSSADVAIVERLAASLPRIVVHNKVDLLAGAVPSSPVGRGEPTGPTTEEPAKARNHVWLSAKTGLGIDILRQQVLTIMGATETAEGAFIGRERHLEALHTTATRLEAAAQLLTGNPPPLELFAEELRQAQVALAAITGEFSADDLLGVIFSRFCLGK